MLENTDKIFPFFIGTWIALGILLFYLFFIKNDYDFKVKYFKYFVILTGLLFIGFNFLMKAPLQVFIIMIPMIILISFLNIKYTRFCKNCGKTIIDILPFSKIKYCTKCGKELQ